jgi:short-subunit dehydrogenase
MKIAFDRGMPPEQVAADILRAIERNRTETVLGRDARWLLGINRLFPRLMDRLIARRVRQLYAQ